MDYPVLDARATGARIKELRVANHLRVEDIARFMGFESEQAVYKWQRGESLPTVDNLYALSFLLGTTVDDILRGKKEKSESPSLPFLFAVCGIHDPVTAERDLGEIVEAQIPDIEIMSAAAFLPHEIFTVDKDITDVGEVLGCG